MDQFTELIEKFARGECTEAERRKVWEYCKRHPEILEQYLTEESWNSFRGDATPVADADTMYLYIKQGIKPRATRVVYYKWAVAAAVIATVASIAWWTLVPGAAKEGLSKKETMPVQAVPAGLVTVYNTTGKPMNVYLPDSSMAELSVNSQLQYLPSFTSNARDIQLSGEALFKVKKDKQRPFTVYNNGISTTALGTMFSVQESGQHHVRVRLYKGKIVVRQVKNTAAIAMQDVYLDPGQELNVDSGSHQPIVQAFRIDDGDNTPMKKPATMPRILVFNNLTLPDILDTLQKEYHVRIVFNREQLQEISFTGKLNKQKETLDDFLKTIGLLNQLTIKKEKQTIYITP
ncbi:MAG: DUF4974 domain-containing protein [Chitinophagaceae bacterium]